MDKKEWYKERLKDPRWKEKREDILRRNKGVCERCGKRKASNVHHRYYTGSKDPWDYPNSALVALCAYCHTLQHYHNPISTFIKKEGSPDLQHCNAIENLAKRRARNAKKNKKAIDAFHKHMAQIAEQEPPVTDNKYILHRPKLGNKISDLLELAMKSGIPFHYNYNHPTLVNPDTNRRVYIPIFFPNEKRAIFTDVSDVKCSWCEANGVNFIFYPNEGDIFLMLKDFIVTGSRYYETYLAFKEDRDFDREIRDALKDIKPISEIEYMRRRINQRDKRK